MRAVIFDFDYTLGDTTDGIVECVNAGLTGLGFRQETRERIRPAIGLTLGDTLELLTGCRDAEKKAAFSRLFMERADAVMVDSASLYPGTVPLLSWLRERGVGTAIVTTKAGYRIRGILERFGVPGLVDVIVGCDLVRNEKPHPEALLLALEKLGVSADDALYVGDSLVDAKCAAAASVPFAGVLTGTTERRDMEPLPHVYILNDIEELGRVLAREL